MGHTYCTTSFKTYDIRGRVPEELNEQLAWRIGYAFAQMLQAKVLVIGHDIRLTSPALTQALAEGICATGCDVIHIGQCGTEEIYFASFNEPVDGGICVTASHNPKDYNGMKLVTKGAIPLNGDQLEALRLLVAEAEMLPVGNQGDIIVKHFRQQYDAFLLHQINPAALKPLRIVTNPGNGGAGDIIDRLSKFLPFEFIRIQHTADGNFPHGVPNPLLPENRHSTSAAIIANNADFGIAWDGDFDRCFFFDEHGNFIEGYYIVGLLAQMMLAKHPGATIVHDPRLYWNTTELIEANGGTAAPCKTGHAFMKKTMRDLNAVYGGEMSAHHYFRDFAFCDNGTLPWLYITELLCSSGKPFSALIDECKNNYPCSGEINLTISNSETLLHKIQTHYQPYCRTESKLDGLGMEFDDWRFNIRQSNTEPLVRLNVESRNNHALMLEKTEELIAFINQ